MARRRKRLGSATDVHRQREDSAAATVEWRVKEVNASLDAVARGDVYSCDQALRDLTEAHAARGEAQAHFRSRYESASRAKIDFASLDKVETRFHKVCVIPSQRRQGR
jgi:uncharacterized protein YicC (UPF0701 family)